MITPDETAIVNFVCLNKKNLDLALSLINSKNDIFIYIIDKFGERLKDKLCSKMNFSELKYHNSYKEGGITPYGGIWFDKHSWSEHNFSLCLEAQAGGLRDFIIGITKQQDKLSPLDAQVVEKLNNIIGNGSSSPYWAWFYRVKKFNDWQEKTTLLDLYDGDAALDYFSNIFFNLQQITSAVLDTASP
jgi:hypothetical protein